MTAQAFDLVTKQLADTTSRRTLLKRLGAASGVALAGVIGMKAKPASAARGIRRACSREGQACGGDSGYVCCPGLVCQMQLDGSGICVDPEAATTTTESAAAR